MIRSTCVGESVRRGYVIRNFNLHGMSILSCVPLPRSLFTSSPAQLREHRYRLDSQLRSIVAAVPLLFPVGENF